MEKEKILVGRIRRNTQLERVHSVFNLYKKVTEIEEAHKKNKSGKSILGDEGGELQAN